MILKRGSSGADVKNMQEYLTVLGYDTNGVDGTFGKGTFDAVVSFQRDMKLDQDGIVGKDTQEKLEWVLDTLEKASDNTVTPWVDEAYKDLGVTEIKGDKHNPKILQMWKDAKLGGIKSDEIPWCSGAACAWMERAGIRSPRTDGAKNWLNWGEVIDKPAYGCVVVFTRTGGGHVGFVVGEDKNGNLLVVGGNQGDSVNVKSFLKSRVSGYRYPIGYTPNYTLPIGDATELSKNEA